MIAELTIAIGAPKWAGLVSNRWNRIGGDRGKLGANVSLRPDGADYAADLLRFCSCLPVLAAVVTSLGR